MTFSHSLKSFVLSFGFIFAFVGADADAAERPNFVIILADDLGYGDLGCYGHETFKTPVIDSLSENGLTFTDFHSSGSVCSPTRCGLMTGRYQQRSNIDAVVTVKDRDHGLQPSVVTFADVLQGAGYATGIFGKWHLGYKTEFNPTNQGFDQFRGYVSGNVDFFSHIDQAGYFDWWHDTKLTEEEGYVTTLLTDHAVKFIDDHHEKPFCVYVAHEAPHYPYQGPDDKADRTVGGKFPTHGSRTDKKEAYKEMVESMDQNIGRILKTLEKHQLTENTFIFFFSDNGPTSLGSAGGLNGFKGSLWEGGMRVPAIAYWPKKIQPGKTNQLSICLDIFPTLLSIAKIEPPKEVVFDGTDLSPLLFQQKSLGERILFWEYKGNMAMRDGDWKLLINKANNKPAQPKLFNLKEDLGEKKDLASSDPGRAKEMQSAIKAWYQDVKKP